VITVPVSFVKGSLAVRRTCCSQHPSRLSWGHSQLSPLGTGAKATFGHQSGGSADKAEDEDAGNQCDNEEKQCMVKHAARF